MSILIDKSVSMDNRDMWLLVDVIKNILGKDLNNLPAEEGWEVCQHFDDLLGIRLWSNYKGTLSALREPLPDEWREFFLKLCSPHGKTILKMYRIKRGLNKCQF